jgi:hypothetical protein
MLKYYLPDYHETPADAHEVDGEREYEAAEQAAEDEVDNGGGDPVEFPLLVAIIGEDGAETRWLVEEVTKPAYAARPAPGAEIASTVRLALNTPTEADGK